MDKAENKLTIAEIENYEGVKYEPDNNAEYPLVIWYNKIRSKYILELNDGDVAKLIRQELFLKYIVPEAIRRLKKNPTIGELYTGEMLTALYKLDNTFWIDNKALLKEVQNLLNELEEDSKAIKNLEWLYEGEKREFHDKVKLFDEKLSRMGLNK